MEFNFDRREIYMPEKYFKKDKLIELSPKENLLFKLLWENKNNVIAYKDIINEVYGYEDITEQDKQNIRKMICRLRQKGVDIKAISGYGYKLNKSNKSF